MKLLKTVMTLFLAITLLSCGSDDSETPSIVGVYTLSQESTTGCNDPADNATENYTCTSTNCETVTISGNGTFSVVEVDSGVTTSFDGTYTLNGNQITFSFTINNVTETETATYTLSGSTLTFTFPADTDGCVEIDTYTRV